MQVKDTVQILQQAKQAKSAMMKVTDRQKADALRAMADSLSASADCILEQNRLDVQAAKGQVSDVMIDRLLLTPERIEQMADGVRAVADLPDPVGRVLKTVHRPNGLVLQKVSVPMGVVAIIYESRPNVTSDAAALAIRSGNVCVLRGGKEAFRSANAITCLLYTSYRMCLPDYLCIACPRNRRDEFARRTLYNNGGSDFYQMG